MMASIKSGKGFLFIGTFICLLQVWLPQYYLTGDGPCHLYNARILRDLWSGANIDLYRSFYNVVYQPDPNWLSSFILAGLMYVVNGIIAEKIFLSLYVLLYVSGFSLLIKKLNAAGDYWVLSFFILVFPLTLAKGFYNFSFSMVFFIWVVCSWIQFLQLGGWHRGLQVFFFVGCTFFTHLLAFVFAGVTCVALLWSWSMALSQPRHQVTRYFLSHAAAIFLFFAPFVLLARRFTVQHGGLQLHLTHHFYRIVELLQLKFLVSITDRERLFLYVASGILFLLFGYMLVKYRDWRKINRFDGLLLSLVFAIVVYLFFPESFMGHLILISMRMQLFVLVLLLCCLAYMLPDNKLKNVVGMLLFICFIGLSFTRVYTQIAVADGIDELLSAADHIRPGTVVLPLNFEPRGRDKNGALMSDNYLFAHASQYIGVAKPLIMLDNYEANMGYFPLRWIDRMNPYYNLSVGAGIEGHPPAADLAHYEAVSGRQPDYILLWCYNDSYLSDPGFSRLYHDIVAGYHQVYTSPAKRAVLFEKNR